MGSYIVGRAGLKLQWRFLEGGLVETHVVYHLATTLVWRQTIKPLFLAIEHSYPRGAIHLVTAANIEIAIKLSDIYFYMRSTLRSVNYTRHAMVVGYLDNILHGVHRAKDIADMCHAHYLGLLVEKGLVCLNVKNAIVAHRDDAQPYALSPCRQLPRHNVGVVLHDRHYYLVARFHHGFGKRGGNEV